MSLPTMTERDYADDPDLAPIEKQFSIVGTKDEEYVRIHSEIGSVTRRVCNHPDAQIEETRKKDGVVVAVTALLPRSVISIKSKKRATDNWSQIVSAGVFDE